MPSSIGDAAAPPVLILDRVLSAIASPMRWAILRELASGRPYAVVELAELLGQSQTSISKHMTFLREAGITEVGRNRLYSIPSAFLPDKEHRILDLGWCVLRLDR
ncbi:MAG: metalloregulator ArsR/SmtB family transcription factor [Chthoniobacterales bacterium]